MRLLVMSDIHVEFHADAGINFAKKTPEADVIVLAGDIGTVRNLSKVLDVFCSRYKHVVYVTGNHEYYSSNVPVVHRLLGEVVKRNPNFHWLDDSAVVIDGQRFIGGTLWFPRSATVDQNREWLNDYYVIKDFTPWVYDKNAATVAYLKAEVKPGDIVVTHHLPAEESVAPRFKGSPYNVFFLCDVSDIIRENKPKLWVHGHTHDSCDYRLGETRVVCNPFGYVRHELNPRFKEDLIVEPS